MLDPKWTPSSNEGHKKGKQDKMEVYTLKMDVFGLQVDTLPTTPLLSYWKPNEQDDTNELSRFKG